MCFLFLIRLVSCFLLFYLTSRFLFACTCFSSFYIHIPLHSLSSFFFLFLFLSSFTFPFPSFSSFCFFFSPLLPHLFTFLFLFFLLQIR